MAEIRNIKDLKAEVLRLKEQSKQQKQQMRSGVDSLKNDLKPEQLLRKSFSSVTGIDVNRNFFQAGVASVITVLITKETIRICSE